MMQKPDDLRSTHGCRELYQPRLQDGLMVVEAKARKALSSDEKRLVRGDNANDELLEVSRWCFQQVVADARQSASQTPEGRDPLADGIAEMCASLLKVYIFDVNLK